LLGIVAAAAMVLARIRDAIGGRDTADKFGQRHADAQRQIIQRRQSGHAASPCVSSRQPHRNVPGISARAEKTAQ
jgi:hypothetical protein